MTAPAVAPVLDVERLTTYNPVVLTTDFNVSFPLFGDGTDLEVWYNGAKLSSSAYSVLSPSGTLSLLIRPVTDAYVRLNTGVSSGTLLIVGAAHPRRTTQATSPFATRDFNLAFSDIIASIREMWRATKRSIKSPPGETDDLVMPDKTTRAGQILGFDSNGLPVVGPGTTGAIGVTAYAASQIATTNLVSPTVRADRDRWSKNHAVAGRDFGVPADTSSSASTPILAIMAALDERGGGIIDLPETNLSITATLDNKYSRVLVNGAGPVHNHDGGTPTYGTVLIPNFAGTVLKHRTPYGASNAKNIGGGFQNLKVVGNGVATRLLEVDSIGRGVYDLLLEDCVGTEAAKFICGVSGTNLAEACDIQRAIVNLFIRQFASGAAQSCKGVVMDGSSNANVSFNEMRFLIQHYNGHALDIISADNNIIDLACVRPGGGTGYTVMGRGPTASRPVGCDSNIFRKISSGSGGAIYLEGTDTGGVTAGVRNEIEYLDTGNGTPLPTKGTGSSWAYRRLLDGSDWGRAFGPTVFIDQIGDLATEKGALSTATVRFRNSTGDVIRVSDGTNEWGLGYVSGALTIFRIAGSGTINLGNGVGVKIWTPGFNGTAPTAKPTVTGSRGANAALASLLTALSSMGLLTDSSS